MVLFVCVSFFSLECHTWHDLLSVSSLVFLLLPFADPRWGMLLIGREPDRPRLMAPKETLLSAACKPVELNADGELRRQRTPTEKNSHFQNVDVLGILPWNRHRCFPLPSR